MELDSSDPLNSINLAKSFCAAKQFENAKHVLLKGGVSDAAPDLHRYLQTDGELRYICKPILKDLAKPAPSAEQVDSQR